MRRIDMRAATVLGAALATFGCAGSTETAFGGPEGGGGSGGSARSSAARADSGALGSWTRAPMHRRARAPVRQSAPRSRRLAPKARASTGCARACPRTKVWPATTASTVRAATNARRANASVRRRRSAPPARNAPRPFAISPKTRASRRPATTAPRATTTRTAFSRVTAPPARASGHPARLHLLRYGVHRRRLHAGQRLRGNERQQRRALRRRLVLHRERVVSGGRLSADVPNPCAPPAAVTSRSATRRTTRCSPPCPATTGRPATTSAPARPTLRARTASAPTARPPTTARPATTEPRAR